MLWFANHRKIPQKLKHLKFPTQQQSTKPERLNKTNRMDESTNCYSTIISSPKKPKMESPSLRRKRIQLRKYTHHTLCKTPTRTINTNISQKPNIENITNIHEQWKRMSYVPILWLMNRQSKSVFDNYLNQTTLKTI